MGGPIQLACGTFARCTDNGTECEKIGLGEAVCWVCTHDRRTRNYQLRMLKLIDMITKPHAKCIVTIANIWREFRRLVVNLIQGSALLKDFALKGFA